MSKQPYKKRSPGKPRAARPDTLEGRIGERVETLRKKAGLKSSELAEAAEMALSSLILVEAGKSECRVGVIVKIAGGLGMTAEKLMRGLEGWA